MIENWVIDILEENCQRYNQFGFIVNDPISIPHQYILNQDVEIAGFFTAIISWGQRKTILNNAVK
ncbi:MAG: DUF2400 family protein, partial [Chitinophagales bacterium]|nr:DUF2400 family protein [Chitinophagales bacterium]